MGTGNHNFPKFKGGFGSWDVHRYPNKDVSRTRNNNCLKFWSFGVLQIQVILQLLNFEGLSNVTNWYLTIQLLLSSVDLASSESEEVHRSKCTQLKPKLEISKRFRSSDPASIRSQESGGPHVCRLFFIRLLNFRVLDFCSSQVLNR